MSLVRPKSQETIHFHKVGWMKIDVYFIIKYPHAVLDELKIKVLFSRRVDSSSGNLDRSLFIYTFYRLIRLPVWVV